MWRLCVQTKKATHLQNETIYIVTSKPGQSENATCRLKRANFMHRTLAMVLYPALLVQRTWTKENVKNMRLEHAILMKTGYDWNNIIREMEKRKKSGNMWKSRDATLLPWRHKQNVNQRLMQKLTPPDRQVHQPPGVAWPGRFHGGWAGNWFLRNKSYTVVGRPLNQPQAGMRGRPSQYSKKPKFAGNHPNFFRSAPIAPILQAHVYPKPR